MNQESLLSVLACLCVHQSLTGAADYDVRSKDRLKCEGRAVDRSSIGALRRALRGNNLMGGMPLHFPPTKTDINQIAQARRRARQ